MPALYHSTDLGAFSVSHAPGLPASMLEDWHARIAHWPPFAPLAGASALNQGEVFLLRGTEGDVVVKRRFERGWKHLALRLGLRRAPLLRAFMLGLEARDAGLRTPAPLACWQRDLPSGRETVLVCDFVEGMSPWEYLHRAPERRPGLLRGLGAGIAAWHAAGFRHRDLKNPNLLYLPDEDALCLLDLDGARRVLPQPSPALRAQDLSRLRSSALGNGLGEADWALIGEAYLAASEGLGIALPRPEDFSRAVARRAGRKLRSNRRRGRPLG